MCSRSAARRKPNVSATAMNRLNWRRSIMRCLSRTAGSLNSCFTYRTALPRIPMSSIVNIREGGSSGIGFATARRPIEDGYRVAIVARRARAAGHSISVGGLSPSQRRAPGPLRPARSSGFVSLQRFSDRQPQPMHSSRLM